MRLLKLLWPRARDRAEAAAEAERHRVDHQIAMRAVQMKVQALQTGAERIESESRKTEKAAAALLARLRQDFPA